MTYQGGIVTDRYHILQNSVMQTRQRRLTLHKPAAEQGGETMPEPIEKQANRRFIVPRSVRAIVEEGLLESFISDLCAYGGYAKVCSALAAAFEHPTVSDGHVYSQIASALAELTAGVYLPIEEEEPHAERHYEPCCITCGRRLQFDWRGLPAEKMMLTPEGLAHKSCAEGWPQ